MDMKKFPFYSQNKNGVTLVGLWSSDKGGVKRLRSFLDVHVHKLVPNILFKPYKLRCRGPAFQ